MEFFNREGKINQNDLI